MAGALAFSVLMGTPETSCSGAFTPPRQVNLPETPDLVKIHIEVEVSPYPSTEDDLGKGKLGRC